MIEVKKVTEYSSELANGIRALVKEFSRQHKDEEIPVERFEDIIKSPWNDLLIAVETETGRIVGMAALSTILGVHHLGNAYLEDFAVAESVRGQGVGSKLWQEAIRWGKDRGYERMEFTCGNGREAALAFYEHRGAKIYETNFLRVELQE